MIFNWQDIAWKGLVARQEKLPHALLLTGRPGMGKSLLAETFAQALLCRAVAENGLPCGRCEACNWFSLGNHPDYRLLQPDSMAPDIENEPIAKKEKKKSDQIRIEQVRGLESFLSVGTHRGGMRVVVIDPADAMNFITQNAILKNLEEPLPATLFMLVASRPQRLLATVRSRCQTVAILPPPPGLTVLWLKEQGITNPEAALAAAAGAPLAAVTNAETEGPRLRLIEGLKDPVIDAIALTQLCDGIKIPWVVSQLQCWVFDLLSATNVGTVRYNPEFQASIEQLCKRSNAIALTKLLHRLTKARALVQHPLNARLFLEDIFLEYSRALKKSP